VPGRISGTSPLRISVVDALSSSTGTTCCGITVFIAVGADATTPVTRHSCTCYTLATTSTYGTCTTTVGPCAGRLIRVSTTATTADMDVDAANITVSNLLFTGGVDELAGPIDINAADFTMINCETRDVTGQAVDFIDIAKPWIIFVPWPEFEALAID
jgi:hypothetical protein